MARRVCGSAGGAAFAQSSDNEFIVVGQQIRLKFGGAGTNAGKPFQYLRVEEGRFDPSGKWIMERNWNGDQVDSGLNLPARPTVLKVRMGTYWNCDEWMWAGARRACPIGVSQC